MDATAYTSYSTIHNISILAVSAILYEDSAMAEFAKGKYH